MTAVGFTFMVGALTASDDSVVFTIGVLLSSLYFVVFAHMVLAYPDGRLERPWHAKLLVAGYALALIGPLPQLLWGFTDRMGESCPDCPESALLIETNDTLRDVFNAVTSIIGVALVAVILVILIRRWRAATPAQRRALAPVLWSGVAMLVLLATALGTDAAGISRLTDVLGWLGLLVFASVPWVFLIGLVRSRVARAGAVSELLLRLGEAPGTGTLRCRLSEALGDRSLQLVFWLEDKGKWVDSEGHKVELPVHDTARAWTAVELEGRRVGAIVHDLALCEEPELLGSVAAAAGLAMRERAPSGAAARPCRGAAHVARADRRGRHARAPPARAQPARRRPAAAGRALADPAAGPGQGPPGPREGERVARRRPAGARRWRSASCASWRAASTRPCCPTADLAPRSRRSPGARRSRSTLPSCPATGCPSRSRRPPTS